MTEWICRTCMNEFPESGAPPSVDCPVCSDERQYLPPEGQLWTSPAELAAEGWQGEVEELETDLWAVRTTPRLGIGQRGLLLRTDAGNLLWEPPGALDDSLVQTVRDLGGVAVLASSHPHLVGASVRWSRALGGVPVLKHVADRAWITRPDAAIRLWEDDHEVLPGARLVHAGGHFAGSAVLHWSGGAQGRGVLLSGDTVAIGADRTSVNVMRSYVNNIPLPEAAVQRIRAALAPLSYDRIYSAFGVLPEHAKERVDVSLRRYVRWLRGEETGW